MPSNPAHFNDQFNQDILDSLTVPVAVLEQGGIVITTNNAWRRFGAENNTPGFDRAGVNFFAVIKDAGVSPANVAELKTGIEAVSVGQLHLL